MKRASLIVQVESVDCETEKWKIKNLYMCTWYVHGHVNYIWCPGAGLLEIRHKASHRIYLESL